MVDRDEAVQCFRCRKMVGMGHMNRVKITNWRGASPRRLRETKRFESMLCEQCIEYMRLIPYLWDANLTGAKIENANLDLKGELDGN